MASFRRQWPVVPTFVHGGMNYGQVQRPPGPNGAGA
jgi:hypothetical protein